MSSVALICTVKPGSLSTRSPSVGETMLTTGASPGQPSFGPLRSTTT